jgi:hypothetical protein
MKKYAAEFFKRGMMFCWGGPVIMAIIYFCLSATGTAPTIETAEVAKNILTITLLAFVAASITTVYQIEELPLFPALLLHGVVLYLDYLIIYLFNGWLKSGAAPFLIFTLCFVLGYLLIWVIINAVTRAHAKHLNNTLESKGK